MFIFFKDEWVGYSTQSFRKSQKYFYWKDQKTYEEIILYIKSHLNEEYQKADLIDEDNLTNIIERYLEHKENHK